MFDPLDPRRRAPVEKTALEYLIYGNFKSDNVANDPGLPDQRWMSLDDVLDAVGRRSAVESKLKAYESGLTEARVAALEMERESAKSVRLAHAAPTRAALSGSYARSPD